MSFSSFFSWCLSSVIRRLHSLLSSLDFSTLSSSCSVSRRPCRRTCSWGHVAGSQPICSMSRKMINNNKRSTSEIILPVCVDRQRTLCGKMAFIQLLNLLFLLVAVSAVPRTNTHLFDYFELQIVVCCP